MFILLLIIWFLFTGSLTVMNLIYGIVASALLTLFCAKFLGYRTRKLVRLLAKSGEILSYLAFLMKSIVRSNLMVMRVLYRAKEPEPVLMRFQSGLKTDGANVLVANSITLTPGTYTVSLEGDIFTVHALDEVFTDGLEESSFIVRARKLEG